MGKTYWVKSIFCTLIPVFELIPTIFMPITTDICMLKLQYQL